jgi:bacillithiol system protein YtxJ
MENHFTRVSDVQALDDLIEQSKKQPVVIFKHSTTCPISASAFRNMSNFNGDVNLVEVQSARELSREIERRTGVRHESPQVIVLNNGQVVWDASHWKVRADSVAEALKKLHAGTVDTE